MGLCRQSAGLRLAAVCPCGPARWRGWPALVPTACSRSPPLRGACLACLPDPLPGHLPTPGLGWSLGTRLGEGSFRVSLRSHAASLSRPLSRDPQPHWALSSGSAGVSVMPPERHLQGSVPLSLLPPTAQGAPGLTWRNSSQRPPWWVEPLQGSCDSTCPRALDDDRCSLILAVEP